LIARGYPDANDSTRLSPGPMPQSVVLEAAFSLTKGQFFQEARNKNLAGADL